MTNVPHIPGGATGPQAVPHSHAPSRIRLMLLLIALLLLSFFIQLPGHRVADWQLFAVYDPGTVLKGDAFLARVDATHPDGYIPTVDFGYTHGLVAMAYGRLGFSVLGLHPWTFLFLTVLVELAMAYALARILIATGIARNKGALILFLVGLPIAIMPAYLTLAHPLEAMLILLALASHAEGNRSRALALLTVCLFVKPSMAYVYGALLLVLLAWQYRSRLGNVLNEIVPAALALVIVYIALWYRFGFTPVLKTLLPLTGAHTYEVSHFGFFRESGWDFWLPLREENASFWKLVGGYLGVYLPPTRADVAAPIGMFLGASAAAALGAAVGLGRMLKMPAIADGATRCAASPFEMLLTIGTLHTVFLLGFYGWKGSWAYYSYLPMLGLALGALILPLKRTAHGALFAVLIALVFFSHAGLFIECAGAWGAKQRTARGPGADAGLWVWPADSSGPSKYEQWQAAVKWVGNRPTVVMTDGWLPNLPKNIEMRDTWFPQPGIPTESEIARLRAQVEKAECVLLYNEYEEFDVWNSAAMKDLREQFVVGLPQKAFTVLQRKVPVSSNTAPASTTGPETRSGPETQNQAK